MRNKGSDELEIPFWFTYGFLSVAFFVLALTAAFAIWEIWVGRKESLTAGHEAEEEVAEAANGGSLIMFEIFDPLREFLSPHLSLVLLLGVIGLLAVRAPIGVALGLPSLIVVSLKSGKATSIATMVIGATNAKSFFDRYSILYFVEFSTGRCRKAHC